MAQAEGLLGDGISPADGTVQLKHLDVKITHKKYV